MKRLCRLGLAIAALIGLGACVYAPPPPAYGYGYAPGYAYAPSYAYAPGPYYYGPPVSLGFNFGFGHHWR